jgi:pyruvate formate lyase activating enzyme
MACAGIVFNIQRHSIHDGPGIRTILFLKGCPLSCLWCSNPESQAFARELSFDRAACRSCGACAEVCYAGGRTMEGRVMGAEEAVEEVYRDEPFFRRSGGGLTLGGGEPLAQPEFAGAVLRGFKAKGLSTAVETAGHVPWENFNHVIPHVDYFLFDIKHTDPQRHKRFTGADTRLIQENLEKLARLHSGVVARVPVIPGFNFDGEDLLAIADRAAALGLREINFLPYHGYGSGKYGLLGRAYPMKTFGSPPSTAQIVAGLERLRSAVEKRGLKVCIGG